VKSQKTSKQAGSPEPKAGLAAFILTGGKSSRMGEDKARLQLGGQTLLEIAIEKAKAVSTTVGIVGSREKFGVDAIEDVFPNCGPLGGIHAALKHSSWDLNLILAVDTPFVEAAFLPFLAQQAEASKATVTVARTSDGFQPLCAIYRRNFRDMAEIALKEHRYKIDALFSVVKLRVVEEAEMRQFAFSPAMFQNLNTRAEYERAKMQTK
jgi:molybdopterin-guanine dinucleotide biosynthesis protein A